MTTQDVVDPSAETEQGVVQLGEQGMVQTVEPPYELTLKQKKEKKKKKTETTPQVSLEEHDKRWMAHAGTLQHEPKIPKRDGLEHRTGCLCMDCSINRCWHRHQEHLIKYSNQTL